MAAHGRHIEKCAVLASFQARADDIVFAQLCSESPSKMQECSLRVRLDLGRLRIRPAIKIMKHSYPAHGIARPGAESTPRGFGYEL